MEVFANGDVDAFPALKSRIKGRRHLEFVQIGQVEPETVQLRSKASPVTRMRYQSRAYQVWACAQLWLWEFLDDCAGEMTCR